METKTRILVVEDEESLRDAIKLNLDLEGFHTDISANGKEALNLVRQRHYNLLILDVMLPEMDGFTLCEIIRLENKEVPILFLSAKGSGEDRIRGLKMGADDYLTKPFNLEELLLRVNVLIRRSNKTGHLAIVPDTFFIGDKAINFDNYLVTYADGKTFHLTKRETMLLKLLVERKNQVVPRETILSSVWGYDVYPTTRTIDNFILNFRKYFEPDPKHPIYFHSIRGVGYKFTG